MKQTSSKAVRRLYLFLTFGNTLAASLIWGINTIFLLDAGLSNFEAFAANAFFTLGMVFFEVPTGIVADTWGRRASFLLGTVTLSLSTLLYFLLWHIHAPFWEWAAVSVLLGLGFTFFSGATEAWLVDALHATKFKGNLETVFGQGQMATGIAMLVGSIGGGVIAQYSTLGAPFILRAVILALMFTVAFIYMKDLGFAPEKTAKPVDAMRNILRTSLKEGFGNPPVKWLMLAAPFGAGVGIYGFYAAQPYLLELYGDEKAYVIAGLAAALVAASQVAGGFLSSKIGALPYRKITILAVGTFVSAVALVILGTVSNFALALLLLAIWGMVFAMVTPVRQAYINKLIPSKQRATVLSFDSLMGSAGGVVIQPALGKSADVWSYGTSFVISGIVSAIAVPLIVRSKETIPEKVETQL
jgi:MFS family permease